MTSPRSASDLPLAPSARQIGLVSGELPTADWTREQFHEAVTPLVPRLFRLALALSGDESQAEDLLQAGLIRAYRRRSSFLGSGSLLGWLCQIVRNEHIDHRRKEARRRSLFDAARECADFLVEAVARSTTDPEEWICETDAASHLLACLQEVPEVYRVVLVLCDIEEMSHSEAAEVLGIPTGTVKSRQLRGRRHLKKAYQRQGNGKGGA